MTEWLEEDFNYSLENDVDSSSLSLYNLFTNKEFKIAYLAGDKKKVNELLHTVGVDLEQGWCIVDRLHRPLGSKVVVNGAVLLYKERTDDKWIKGGFASMEAVIRSTGDLDTRIEMMRMQDAYLGTGKLIDKCKGV